MRTQTSVLRKDISYYPCSREIETLTAAIGKTLGASEQAVQVDNDVKMIGSYVI